MLTETKESEKSKSNCYKKNTLEKQADRQNKK